MMIIEFAPLIFGTARYSRVFVFRSCRALNEKDARSGPLMAIGRADARLFRLSRRNAIRPRWIGPSPYACPSLPL